MSNKKVQKEDELQAVENALTQSEQFIEKNRKQLIIGLCAIFVVIIAIVLFHTQYLTPRNVKAADKLATCVYYFEQDSFALALNGDGANEGFADIAKNYGITETADLASLYAGICCYKLGDYKAAISYLEDFDAKSVNMTPANITLIGDCYVALEDYTKAVKFFEKAGAIDNGLTAPRALNKAGICYEELGNYAAAEKCYQTIKDKYFASQYIADIDKRIERCKTSK